MNPQSDYDLIEQRRLELLKHAHKAHHHNRLLGHRPQPWQFITPIKNGLRTILKLRYLRIRIRLEMTDPYAKRHGY